jgi:F-type H+-transporting ATPase subunit epsilon
VNSYQLRIVTPERPFFEGACTFLILRTEDGEIGVLHGHTPLVSPLVPTMVDLRLEADSEGRRFLAVSGGFLEVRAEQVTVLARTAEWAGDIDQERAQSALMRAEEHLADSGADRQRARFAKRRAQARLQAAHAQQAVVGRLAHGASAG